MTRAIHSLKNPKIVEWTPECQMAPGVISKHSLSVTVICSKDPPKQHQSEARRMSSWARYQKWKLLAEYGSLR